MTKLIKSAVRKLERSILNSTKNKNGNKSAPAIKNKYWSIWKECNDFDNILIKTVCNPKKTPVKIERITQLIVIINHIS